MRILQALFSIYYKHFERMLTIFGQISHFDASTYDFPLICQWLRRLGTKNYWKPLKVELLPAYSYLQI